MIENLITAFCMPIMVAFDEYSVIFTPTVVGSFILSVNITFSFSLSHFTILQRKKMVTFCTEKSVFKFRQIDSCYISFFAWILKCFTFSQDLASFSVFLDAVSQLSNKSYWIISDPL